MTKILENKNYQTKNIVNFILTQDITNYFMNKYSNIFRLNLNKLTYVALAK